MTGLPFGATLAAALGCGLIAGVFFAFSSFVMPALGRLPAREGIAAMQSINRLAVTPAFMTALFGTAAVCIGLAIWAVFSSDDPPTGWIAAGAAIYVIGTPGVTMAFNVPLNNELEAQNPDGAEAHGAWQRYLTRWTAWNHVRTLAALAATVAFILALNA